jgi:hypothetical protein
LPTRFIGEQWRSFEGVQGFEGFETCACLHNDGEVLQGFEGLGGIFEAFDFHDCFL